MTTGAERDPAPQWFVRLPPRAEAPVRVIGFPSVGNGPAQFSPLARAGRGRLEVWAANLPGRQARYTEPSFTRFDPLIDALVPAVAEVLDDRPCVLVGYCSGSLIAFGLVRALRRRGLPAPAGLVCVAYPPPRDGLHPDLSGVSSDDFWDHLLHSGGVPARLATGAHRPLFEPALRADYAVLRDFRPADPQDVIDTHIYAVVGTGEPAWLREEMSGWARLTSAGCQVVELDGGHWLLDESPEAFVDLVAEGRWVTDPARSARS
ncbi:thioesterase II family protein [Phytohabitans houttuyneae]|uniref:Thioesterase TesA-like domain-containing protein n=1 Tax=Phytohabitans houttuyneae TaxID=1076126 RepID=A0A6V8K3E8_9ACTN|nr:alpha/beta fold hydrolase [Phytohabitans houttuyneae]GFJ78040.1 hypothetical protein Phou_022200 [Phytohabitans houttuyneae]